MYNELLVIIKNKEFFEELQSYREKVLLYEANLCDRHSGRVISNEVKFPGKVLIREDWSGTLDLRVRLNTLGAMAAYLAMEPIENGQGIDRIYRGIELPKATHFEILRKAIEYDKSFVGFDYTKFR